MSYNISTWTTKKIEALQIPLGELLSTNDIDINVRPSGYMITGLSEGFRIDGVLNYENPSRPTILVSKISNYGERSGNAHEIVYDLLSRSTGALEAILVWEGGDSITRLVVQDGEITEKPLE